MGGGGKSSKPVYTPVQAPTVAATPPEPEQVAEKVERKDDYVDETKAKRKGTSSLRINLNVGGQGTEGATANKSASSNGLVIPR